jgi:Fe-S cluster assembly protein SufD
MPADAPALSTLGGFTAEAFALHLAGQAGAPDWWLERKRAAYEEFAARPMPRRTDESWRFSRLEGFALDGFAPASAAPAAVHLPFAALPNAAELAFVNGGGGRPPPLPEELRARGVVVTTLREALERHGELLQAHFMAQPQKLGSEKFAQLHTAFVPDGAFVLIPRGVEIEAPILVRHLAAGSGSAVFPHTLVVAEDHSRATVIDLFASAPGGAGGARHFACGANDLYAGHGARLTYVAAQNWSEETLALQLNSTVVRRDARVQSLNLHLGGRQSRHESLSQLQAPGAFSEMLALTIAHGAQEFDQRTLQIHQAPDTKSDLLYKNALRGGSRTIFSGLIVVDPDAQRTDAYQSNRNLMLSDDAEASSLPGLEIQANDVRCTHGATTSRIDREQEFYLQSRGLGREIADELLVFGFFEEVLGRLEQEELREALRGAIRAKFQP